MKHGRIPSDFIDHLISSTDIIDVIARAIPLKKRGNSHTACCPFHHEKTPSFHVSQQKQIYHCFGCGASGNVITFLREHDHLDFIDAIEELASLKGTEVPYSNAQAGQPREDLTPLYGALQTALNFYRWQLKHHKQSPEIIEYIKSRHISATTAKIYGIGYAPKEWGTLTDTLKQKYGRQTLIDAGLTIQKTPPKYYDRFRNRLIFPIRNRQGKVIGFGGRILNNAPNQPKYLNSPETKIFHKGEELYGLYEIKQQKQALDHLLIVEGYMDVIGLAEHGYVKSVATLGTSLTEQHLKRIFRETDKLIFCFDGDLAGQQAALRSLQLVLPFLTGSRAAYFLTLDHSEDPDSLIHKIGLKHFEEKLQYASSLIDFLFEHIAKEYVNDTYDGQAQVIEFTKNLLEKIPENSHTILIKNRLSSETGVTAKQLDHLFLTRAKINPTNTQTAPRKKQVIRFNPNKLTYIEKALLFILNDPSLCAEITLPEPIENSQDSNIFFQIIQHSCHFFAENQVLSTAMLIQSLCKIYPEHEHYLYQLAAIEINIDKTQMSLETNAALHKNHHAEQSIQLKKILEKSKSYPLSAEEKQLLKGLLHKSTKP
jgi:DNA primase